jgi:IS30 family transposase
MDKQYEHLSSQERERIAIGVAQGQSARAIARALCRSNSTISREIRRNATAAYSGVMAHEAARQRLKKARRPTRLPCRGPNNGLWCNVVRQLRRGLSPEQAARRLKARHPHQPEFWVSHQTIYRAIYILSRGELKRGLMDCLRRDGKPYKKPGAPAESRRRWIEHLITARPVEAADRLTLGHWEGDLVIGQSKSPQAIGVLYERTTRHIRLIKLARHDAWSTYRGFKRALRRVPAPFCQTLTYDQGCEMAEHRRLTAATGIQVFFCHPHSPWERPGCENVNGLIREYLPKGYPLDDVSQAFLNKIAYVLNTRPRKTLNWRTPNEVWKAMTNGMTFEQAIHQPIS